MDELFPNINPDTGLEFQTDGEKRAAVRKQKVEAQQQIDAANEELMTGAVEHKGSAHQGVKREDYTKYGTDVIDNFDYNERRAQNQSGGEKALHALGKMGTLTGTTFADGIIGTLWGAVEFLGTGDPNRFIQNKFSNNLAEITAKAEQALPNYLTKAQQETPWYLRAATGDIDFWGDTVFKNFGFALGAMASGALVGGVLASGGKKAAKSFTHRIAKELAKSPDETLRALAKQSPDDIAEAIATGKIRSEMLSSELLKDAKQLGKTNAFAEWGGSLIGAMGEARIEAIGAAEEFANKLAAQGVDLDSARTQAKSVANSVFVANTLLLTMSNMLQYKRAFGGGFNPESRTYNKLIRGNIDSGYEATKRTTLGKTVRVMQNPVTEMVEEMNQGVIQKAFDDYYTMDLEPNAVGEVNSMLSSYLDAFAEVYGSEDGWEQGFAGFITGAIGLPNIVKLATEGKFQMEGGIKNTYQEMVSDEKNAAEHAEKLNAAITPEMKRAYSSFVVQTNLNNTKETALEKGDPYAYKNAEVSQLIETALTFAKAGKLNDLYEHFSELKNLKGADLRDALTIRTDAKGDKLADDSEIDPNDTVDDTKLEEEFKERIKSMEEITKAAMKHRRAAEVKFGGRLDEKSLDAIAHDLTATEDTEYRISQLSGEIAQLFEEHFPDDLNNLSTEQLAKRLNKPAEMYGKALGTLSMLSGDTTLTEGVNTLSKYLADDSKVLDMMSYLKTSVPKIKNSAARIEITEKLRDVVKLINRRRGLLNTYSAATDNPQAFQMMNWDNANAIQEEILKAQEKKAGKSLLVNKLLNGSVGAPARVQEDVVDKATGKKTSVTHRSTVTPTSRGRALVKDANGDPMRFDVVGVNNKNAVVLKDANGNNAYFNFDGTFSYKAGGFTNSLEVDNFDILDSALDNMRKKRLQAKLFALEEFANAINSNVVHLEQEIQKIEKEAEGLKKELEEAQEEYNVYLKNKEGRTKEARSVLKQIKVLNAAIEESKIKRNQLSDNIDKLVSDRDLIVKDLQKTTEEEDRKISLYYKASREKYDSVVQEIKKIYEDFDLIYQGNFERLDNAIKDTQKAIEEIDNKINKLESYRDTLYSVVSTDLFEYSNTMAFEKIQSILVQLGMDEGVNAERLLTDLMANGFDSQTFQTKYNLQSSPILIEEFKELQDKLKDAFNLVLNTSLTEDQLRRIDIQRKKLLAQLEGLEEIKHAQRVHTYYKKLKNKAHDIYYNLVASASKEAAKNNPAAPVAPDTKVEDSIEKTHLEELAKQGKFTDPSPTFQNHVEIFYRPTAGKEDKIVENLQKNNYKNDKERIGDLGAKAWFDFSRDAENIDDYIIRVYSSETVPKELKDKLYFKDKEHLLAVPVRRLDGKVVGVEEGIVPAASMPDATWVLPSGYNRFSNMKDVSEEVKLKLMDEWIQHRNILLSNVADFPILWKTPGAINSLQIDLNKPYIQQLNDPKGTIFKDTSEIKDINVVNAEKDTIALPGSNREINVRKGYTYIEHKDTVVLGYQKKLSDVEGAVDRIYNIIEYIVKNPTSKEVDNLIKNLFASVYLTSNSKNAFRLDFSKNRNSVIFGNKTIKAKDLENADTIEQLKNFIGNKYHNVSSIYLKNSGDFVLYNIENGKIVEKLYESTKGGYKNYLLEDSDSPKLKFNLRGLDEQQFLNSSLQLTPEADVANSKFYDNATDKNTTVYEDELNDLYNTFLTDFNSNFGEAVGKLIEIGTNNIEDLQSILTDIKRAIDSRIIEGEDLKEKAVHFGANLYYIFTGEHLAPNKTIIVDESVKLRNSILEEDSKNTGNTQQPTPPPVNNKSKLYRKKLEIAVRNNTQSEEKVEEALNRFEEIISKNIAAIEAYEGILADYPSPIPEVTSATDNEDDSNISFYRVARISDDIEKLITNKEIKWFENLLPGVNIRERIGKIDGNKLAELQSATELLLSDEAVEGTLYHEAFHTVSLYILTKQERDALYKEVTSRKGTVLLYDDKSNAYRKNISELIDREVEEFLAEEFRDYMLTGVDNYKFGKANALQQTFFQKLYNFVKEFFNNKRVKNLFKRIASGEKFDVNSTVENNPYPRVAKFSEAKSIAMIQDFNTRFFTQALFSKESGFNFSDLNKNIASFRKYHDRVIEEIKKESNDITLRALEVEDLALVEKYNEQVQFYSDMLANKNELITANTRYLSQFGVNKDFFTDSRLEEEGKGKDSQARFESNLVSVKEYVPNVIKFILAGIPVLEHRTTGAPIKVKGKDFNNLMLENYSKLINSLHNNLSGKVTLEQMIEELNSMITKNDKASAKYRIVKSIIAPRVNISKDRFDLQTQFFNHFAKNKTNPLITVFKEEDVYITDALSESGRRAVVNKWKNNIKVGVDNGSNKVFYKDANNNIVANINTLTNLSGRDFLNALGIENVDGIFKNSAALNAKSFIKDQLEKYKEGNDTKIISVDAVFDREGLESSSDFKKLADGIIMYSGEDVELSWINPENKREYAITLNSHLSNTIHALKTGAIPEYLKAENNENVRNSKWLPFAKNLDIVLLRGAKAEYSGGTETSSLSPTDFTALLTNAILSGYSPYLRAADRKLEYAFVNPVHEYAPTVSTFANNMTNYLRDTLAVTLVINNGKHNLKNFNKKTALSFFEKWFDSEGDKVLLTNLLTPQTIEGLEAAIEENKEALDKIFFAQYKKGAEEVKNRLITEGVISGENVLGVSKEALKKNGILQNGKPNMDTLAETVYYNYTVGAIEQTKLITGDPRHFKSAEDFHKRTTGAASTRGNSMWGELFNNSADKFYPRVDNKIGNSRDVIKTLVYTDVEPKSPIYTELFGAKNAVATEGDAQGRVTIDEYRELMLRNGKWSDELQETYNYEQYLFLKRAYEITKYEKFNDKLRELGLENKYTEDFNPVYLKAFPPLKPQGFGNLYNADGGTIGGYVSDFTKLSVEPILTATASEFMFDRLLDMVENQIGLTVFESGKKGDKLIDEEGNMHSFYDESGANGDIIPSIIQGLHYRDFGIQMDIDPSGKEKATRSIQMEKLWVVNYPGADKAEVVAHHKEARDGLNELATIKVLKQLGITETKDGYKITNTEQFKETLAHEFEQRIMADTVYEGLIAVAENIEKGATLDTLVSKDAVQSVINSMIRKNLLQIKTKGDMLVQTSAVGYEEGARKVNPNTKQPIGINPHLKFYEKKNGKVTPMEVQVPLPKQWGKWIIENFEGNTFLDKLKTFNDVVASGKLDERFPEGFMELIHIPLNRTPSDDLHTIGYAKIKSFLPPHAGSKIIVPTELVLQSGSDFDIDKLTAYYNNFTLNEKGAPMYERYYKAEEINSEVDNILWERNKEEIVKDNPELFEKRAQIYEEADAKKDKRIKGIKISAGIRDSRVSNITNAYVEKLQQAGVTSIETMLNTKDIAVQVAYSAGPVYSLGLASLNAAKAIKAFDDTPTKRNYRTMVEAVENAIGTSVAGYTAEQLRGASENLEELGNTIISETQAYHKAISKESAPFKEYLEKAAEVRNEIYKERDAKLKEEVYTPAKEIYNSFSLAQKNGKQALENHLNNVIKKAVLHPDNYKRLLYPQEALSLDPSKAADGTFAKQYATTSKPSLSNLIEFGHNLDVAKNNWEGVAGVGLDAVQIASHAVTQVSPIRIKDANLKMWFKHFTPSKNTTNVYKIGFTKDIDGEYISKSFGEFLTAFVDIAKDPYIAKLNAGVLAFNTWALLLRTGAENEKGEIAPASLEMVGRFMNQPIIKEYVKRRINEESLLKKTQGKYKTKEDTIKDLIKEFGTEAQIKKYTQTTAENPVQSLEYVKLEEYLTNKEFNDISAPGNIGGDFKYLTSTDLKGKFSDQVMILDMFLMYQQYAKELSKLNKITRPEASLPNSQAGIKEEIAEFEEVRDSSIFRKDDIENIFNHTYLGKLSEVRKNTVDYFSDLFLVDNIAFRKEFKLLTAKVMGAYRTRKTNTPLDKRVAIAKKLEQELLTFILHNAPDNNGEVISQKYGETLSTDSSNTTVKQALKMKDKYPQNPLLNYLQPVINEYNTRTKKTSNLDNIKLFANTSDIEHLNSLTTGFKELFETEPEFAIQLAKLAITQTGYSSSFMDYRSVIPESYWFPVSFSMINNFINQGNLTTETLNQFIDLFYQNNINDDDLIPKVFKDTPTGSKNAERGYNYLKTYDKAAKKYRLWKRTAEDTWVLMAEKGVPHKWKDYSIGSPSMSMNDAMAEAVDEGMITPEMFEDYSIPRKVLTSEVVGQGLNYEAEIVTPEGKKMLITHSIGGKNFDVVYDYNKDTGTYFRTQGPMSVAKTNEIANTYLGKDLVAAIKNWVGTKDIVEREKREVAVLNTKPSPTSAVKSKARIVKGDIWKQPGVAVITTNLGGVHGAGLANQAYKKGYLTYKKDGGFGVRKDKVVSFPVKKVWKDKTDVKLLKESARKLIALANENPSTQYNLPLIGLGHGEGNLMEILPIIKGILHSTQNVNLVLPTPQTNRGKQGTARTDKSLEIADQVPKMLHNISIPEDMEEGRLWGIKEFPTLSDLPVTDEVVEATKQFLTKIGVDYQEVSKIMNDKGVNASGIAKLMEMVLQVEKSPEGLASLPEEAAHFYTALLPKDNALRKKMMNDITEYKVYEDVKKMYGKIYDNNEELIRLEAAGKLIGEQMKAIAAGKEFRAEYSSWVRELLAKIAKWLGRKQQTIEKDSYLSAAYNIMQGKVDGLISERGSTKVKEMYNLYESRAKQAGYAFADEYQARKKQQEMIRKENERIEREEAIKREVAYVSNQKVDTSEDARTRMLKDFQTYFPSKVGLDAEEKQNFIDNLTDAEVEMYCY